MAVPSTILNVYDEALVYDKALALKWQWKHGGRGNVLNELKRCDEALAAYDNSSHSKLI